MLSCTAIQLSGKDEGVSEAPAFLRLEIISSIAHSRVLHLPLANHVPHRAPGWEDAGRAAIQV